ncbi:Dam family site-specific DNA-(adenine-N6)-methyltransferase [Alteromonadaceae bacterium BrNp21-10]|nr:Dam family site-specific DNA-(adenine-N6)-methyltransferase [Alteromonadaceae bacterium BrNp21-10]
MSNLLTPPLKWAGGKRWLTPILQDVWSQHQSRRLVEPFAGGLAVALTLNPKTALLNDTNPHLINFYQQINQGLKVTKRLSNSSDYFYRRRQEFNDKIRRNDFLTEDAAQLFYFLNRTGYNGLCRFNNSGLFNVPFGRYKKINYRQDFDEFSGTFKHWDFKNVDFAELNIESDDFLYLDPPYDSEFTKYCKKDFTWDDQVRLVEWLADKDGPIISSNQATDRVLSLYRQHGFQIALLKAPRMISCNGDRKPAVEMFAWKNMDIQLKPCKFLLEQL